MNKRLRWLAIVSLGPGLALADPVVIYDNGHSRPLSRYLASIQPVSGSKVAAPSMQPRDAAPRFPIRTPELSPGPVISRKVHQPLLARPVFLVGDDDRSLAWLKRFRKRLIEVNAVGLIVNTTSESSVKRIQQAGVGLRMAAIPASELAMQLALSHYPVLISKTRLEQ